MLHGLFGAMTCLEALTSLAFHLKTDSGLPEVGEAENEVVAAVTSAYQVLNCIVDGVKMWVPVDGVRWAVYFPMGAPEQIVRPGRARERAWMVNES